MNCPLPSALCPLTATAILFVALIFQNSSLGQVAGEGETNGGETGPTVAVTVTGPNSVPMGTKVTMIATHDAAIPASKWRAWCSGCDAGHEASRSLEAWIDVLTIDECVGQPGKQTYECEVSDQSLEKQKGRNSKVVEFLTPDGTTYILSPTRIVIPDPVPGSPPTTSTVFLQTMKVTLKCGNLPVGPCSDVCAQEWIDVKSVNKANYMKPFEHLQTRIFPKLKTHWPTCGNMNIWGHSGLNKKYFATAIPRGFSWDWESPTLTDCWMLFFTPAEMVLVDRIPLDKQLMRVDHGNRFAGKNCCGDKWKHEFIVKKQLIARMVGGVKVLTWELL